MKKLMVLVLSIMLLIILVSCSWIILDDTNVHEHEVELTTSWDISETQDDDWLEVPGEGQIGDRFTGSSGTTYELQVEKITSEEEEYYNSNGLDCSGIWKVIN